MSDFLPLTKFVLASGAKQSRAFIETNWIAASPSAPRNDGGEQ